MSEDARIAEHAQWVRLVEAMLFASAEPLPAAALSARLPPEADLGGVLADLAAHYRHRGVNLVEVANGWAFRTAPDLAAALRVESVSRRRLTQAAAETLAVIAYHQPMTRGEIEAVRGVASARGTLDTLIEAGWIRPGRRRDTPGRPVTWVTTPAFLDQFGLVSLDDLPNLAELRAAGLLESGPQVTTLPGGRLPPGMADPEEETEPPGRTVAGLPDDDSEPAAPSGPR